MQCISSSQCIAGNINMCRFSINKCVGPCRCHTDLITYLILTDLLIAKHMLIDHVKTLNIHLQRYYIEV